MAELLPVEHGTAGAQFGVERVGVVDEVFVARVEGDLGVGDGHGLVCGPLGPAGPTGGVQGDGGVAGFMAEDGFLNFDGEEDEEAEGEDAEPVGRGQGDGVEEVLQRRSVGEEGLQDEENGGGDKDRAAAEKAAPVP